MANSSKRRATEHNEKQQVTQGQDLEIPAIRHVGPTLESDPAYLNTIGSGESTPEAQIAEEASRAQPDLRALREQGVDYITGSNRDLTRPEPLKTRLPGDTSSDPHTDVGPDNASTVQHRGESKNRRKRHAA